MHRTPPDETRAAGLDALGAQVDAACRTRLVETWPALVRRLRDSVALADLVALCNETAVAAPGMLIDVVTRLAYLLDTLDVAGLRRWILTGLRLYPAHPAGLSGYFRLTDPAAVASLHAEADGAGLAGARAALQHYLAGFGVTETAIKPRREYELNAPPTRPAISDGVLLLPEHYLALDGADRGDLYRAAAAHALAHLRYSLRHRPVATRKPILVAVISLIEDARVERLMARDHPGLHALWGRFHLASAAKGDLGFAALTARLARALHDSDYADDNYWVNKGRALFAECADRLDDPARFEEAAKILANDLGQMRVRFNPQQYRVEPAYRDDNTLLWDFGEDRAQTPPDEMLARESVQIEPVDADGGVAMHVSVIPQDTARRFHYGEWDYRIESERDNWVTLVERSPAEPGTAPQAPWRRHTSARRIVHDAAAQMLDRSLRLRRQHEGDELDLNAAIESRISQRGRIAPDPRVFQHPGRRRRHVAILLLLDLSESTNDRIGGIFTTVLDVEKRAAALVANSIDAAYDRVALHGFASNGRHDVRYSRIKDFDEPFGEAQRRRLDHQRGALSTRIGVALRHAGASLAAEHAEKKILLFVTDGEPSDIDVHDRRYLVEDACHAVVGLARRDIDTFCLTLDKRADAYVRAIFGEWNYSIVDNAVALPMQVARALAKVTGR